MAKTEWEHTEEWADKTSGEDYNNRLGYYGATDLNWMMYNDKQWVGINTAELPKVTLNFIKQGVNYLIASIMSRPIKAEFNADNIPEPLPDSTDPEDVKNRETRSIIKKLTQAAEMKWEKDRMPKKLRMLLLDAANSGDMCAHVYWDKRSNDFKTDVIDGAQVMFGNPNTDELDRQPYVLIVGREMVSHLKSEAKSNKVAKDKIDRIVSDEETEYQIGERGKIELDGASSGSKKATYIVKYWLEEESGHILWNKSTRFCSIASNVDSGLTRYPIVWGNWSTVKHSYHGNGPISGVIDNQITVNQMYAMCAYWMRMQAFGKVIVDSTKIPEGKWSNKLGEVIYADGSVNDIVKQLDAGQFNSAILAVADTIVRYSKEFIGANEAALGNANPEQASGTAIMMSAKQAAIPHANVLENLTQFIEDLYLVWGEFFQKKYTNRDLFFKDWKSGKLQNYSFDKEDISSAILSCKVNVGPSTVWSEPLLMQNLDNLLKMQAVTPSQYYERIAGMNIIPDVQGLIAAAKLREVQEAEQKKLEQQMALMQGNAEMAQSGPLPSNNPELQGMMGSTAQNGLRASQPK